EPEQERTDHRFAFVVAKPADDTVRAAVVLDFLHSAALARAIVEIAALGDDAVEHGADILKPALGLAQLGGGGGQSNSLLLSEISLREVLQLTASFAQREVHESNGRRYQPADRRRSAAPAFPWLVSAAGSRPGGCAGASRRRRMLRAAAPRSPHRGRRFQL